jgi:hypothetical protein
MSLIVQEASKNSLDKLLPDGHIFLYAGFENGAPVVETIATSNFSTQTTPLRGGESRVVSVGTERFNRHRWILGTGITTFAIGSGVRYLTKHMLSGIKRQVDQIPSQPARVHAVSARLAAAISNVGRRIPREVSPESICVTIQANGTMEYRAFDANGKYSRDASIPFIGTGMDVSTIAEAFMSVVMKNFQKHAEIRDISRILDFDMNEINDLIRVGYEKRNNKKF